MLLTMCADAGELPNVCATSRAIGRGIGSIGCWLGMATWHVPEMATLGRPDSVIGMGATGSSNADYNLPLSMVGVLLCLPAEQGHVHVQVKFSCDIMMEFSTQRMRIDILSFSVGMLPDILVQAGWQAALQDPLGRLRLSHSHSQGVPRNPVHFAGLGLSFGLTCGHFIRF